MAGDGTLTGRENEAGGRRRGEAMQQVAAVSGSAAALVRRSTRPRSPLVLVDGSNLLWRAAYGFPARITTRDGRDVTSVFGFFALLHKALHELNEPAECIVVFDSETGWTGRRQEDPAYKQHRESADFLPVTLAHIQRGLTELGIVWQESGDWAADDVIATYAVRARKRNVLIMSTDKDFYQLLDRPRIAQLNTARPVEHRIITRLQVRERFGIAPEQWCDYRALVGDPSDGIPGVRGIGPIRARRLLAGGPNLDDLHCRVDSQEPMAGVSWAASTLSTLGVSSSGGALASSPHRPRQEGRHHDYRSLQ